MKKLATFVVMLLIITIGCDDNCIRPIPMPSNSESLFLFVKCLLNPITGLAVSRENEDFTTVYKNSLAVMALIHEKNQIEAERIFDVFQDYYNEQGMNFRGFHQVWNPCTGLPDTTSNKWEGDNAFLLLALNYYRHSYGSFGNYQSLAQGLATWLSIRADSCNQIVAEGIADMYAALVPFASDPTIQQSLLKLRSCFFSSGQTSSVLYEHVLDHIVRGILVFCDTAGIKSVGNFRRTEIWPVDNSRITAYSAFSGDQFINVEISTQLLLALKMWQQELELDVSGLQKELEKLLLSGRCNSRSSGLPYFVTDRGDFPEASSLPIIDPTCYLLFYYWEFNPFAPDRRCAEGQ